MLSRREWITRLLLLSGIAGLAGIAQRGAAQTSGRFTREAAKYQDHPNNMQMCGMCKFYFSPGGKAGTGMMGGQMGQGMMGQGMMAAGTCEVVEGQISPMGWCVLYRPLSS